MVQKRGWGVWPWLVVALGSSGCAALDDVQRELCGNGAIEAGEDCDQPEGVTGKSGGTCGQLGKAGDGACRWVCSDDIPCPSDDAWTCGTDGICRRPTVPATWTKAAAQISEGRCDELIAADFDSDGITDLVTVAPPTVSMRYFENDRGAPTPGDTLIVSQTPRPFIGNVVAPSFAPDGATEVPALALNLSRGLGVFLATEDRLITPTPYATSQLADRRYRISPFLFYSGGIPVVSGFLGFADNQLRAVVAGKAVGAIWSLQNTQTPAGDVVVGRFVGLPCDQIAFPYNEGGVGHVALLTPCNGVGLPLPQATQIADIQLPPNTPACVDTGMESPPGNNGKARCRPLHALDINRDGNLDLIITDGGSQIFLAFGDGSGKFSATTQSPASNNPTLPAPYPTSGAAHGPPLAIGDLNDDCALDIIDADGIWLSDTGSKGTCPPQGATIAGKYVNVAPSGDGHHWTDARITDMNRDGVPDAVVGSAFAAGITLFVGTNTSLFNPVSIITQGPVKELTPGDFDGDGVTDLAFAEIGDDTADNGLSFDSVLIAYGAPSGTPSEPFELAQITGVSQLIPTFEQGVYADAIRDLVVSSYDAPVGEELTSVYLFPGDTSRQVEAPYFLLQPGAAGSAQALAVPRRSIFGHFDPDDPTHPRIATFSRSLFCSGTGSGCGGSLWLLPTGEDAEIAPLSAVASTALTVPQETPALPSELSEGNDVLLANLGPDAPGGADRVAIVIPKGSDETLIFTAKAQDHVLAIEGPASLSGLDLTSPGADLEARLRTADVDGDGHLDLVILSPGRGLAVVPWSGAAGGLDLGAAKVIHYDDIDQACGIDKAPSSKGKPALDGAAFQADRDGKQALVVARHDVVLLVAWKDGAPSMSCFPQTTPEGGDGIDGGFAVATGDFDGDGLEDFVISERNGVAVYYAEPAPPIGDEIVTVSTSETGGAQ